MNATTLQRKEYVTVGSHRVAVAEDSLPSTDSVFYKKAKELAAFSGSTCLEEIHSLGKVLRTDPELRSVFTESETINDAKVIAHLSKIAPDFLIAVHNYTTTVLPHIRNSEKAISLLTTENLRKLAIELSHLDKGELKELKSQIESMQGAARPVWATFKESSIIGMGDRQFRSYLNRLRLQPGGEAILRNMHTSNTGFSDKMTRLMGASYCGEITGLGKDALDYIREAARGIDRNKLIAITPQELKGEDLRGLRTTDGKEFSLPPELTVKLATISHDAFRNARATVAGDVPPSASLRNPSQDSVQTEFSNLTNDNRNLTIINALSFALDFAQSSSAEFEIFRDKAVDGNPQGVKLLDKIALKAPEPETISVWEPLPIAKDQLNAAYEKIEGKMAELYLSEQTVLDKMYAYIDSLDVLPVSNEVLKCLHAMKEVYLSRMDLAAQKYIEFASGEGVSNRQVNLFRVYEDKIAQLSRITNATVPGRHYTDSLDLDSLKLYGSSIISVISRFEDSRQPLRMRTQGSLLSNTYSMDFLQSFLEEGNKIIIHRDRQERTFKVNGVSLFFIPQNLPAYVRSLNLSSLAEISLKELIAIEPGRPSGTYSRMFRRMMAELQMTSATHSMGYVNSENERHISALKHIGHELLILGRSQVKFDSGFIADYIPAVLPVHPRLLAAEL